MIVATWNVNSIRARIDRLTAWLERHQPDVLCVQELKVEEAAFPREQIASLGYNIAATYQKTYNGVAIFSKLPLTDVTVGLGDGVEDPQARLVAATVAGMRVISAYIPNGQTVGSEKYAYKLAWLARLRAYLDANCHAGQPLILGGDFNVAPEARDVHDPMEWENETLFHIDARNALENVRAFGLHDAFRLHHDEAGAYSWWDYRMLGFPKNRGLRIDHLLVTASLAPRCERTWIDREERKGKLPSDHAPVLMELSDA